MRRIERDYDDRPRSLEGLDFINEWGELARRAETEVKLSIYRDPYYDANGKTASHVIDKLNTWYHYKCAYCERRYKLDVEHYRPKGEVRDLNNDLVTIADQNGNQTQHPGYYWLGYEWSNLIPACISCNRDGGKNSKFPNQGGYVSDAPLNNNELETERCHVSHIELTVERPLMIHPEYDEVNRMFKFNIDPEKKGIEIEGADVEGRGNTTINICQMNRPEIRMDRLEFVVQPISKSMIAIFKRLESNRINNMQVKMEIEGVLQKIYDDLDDETLSHTYLRGYILESEENFQNIVLPFVTDALQDILFEAYKNYQPV